MAGQFLWKQGYMKKFETLHKAPEHLSAEARKWWDDVMQEYRIDDHGGLLVLQTALEAFDRMRLSQSEIARDGQTILDRFDQRKPHPLLQTERDARYAFMSALKQLNLDLEPLRDGPGRPGG